MPSYRLKLLTTALFALAVLAAGPSSADAQALSPPEALERFKLAEGFHVELYASEPLVRQPVTMTFDDRGRMWVIQYLQYPNPAGLKPVEVDRYLRTKYDRVPEPPPHGPRGNDKVTILEDTDGDGRVDRAKDFVTGLNLASALAVAGDGVYVGQAPYLLFYPDRNQDDVPDGDPEVLLTGFGLEDAHAVVNSLEWGPDGWLYGAQGSTVTADIRGIGFQQGIWRYHPSTKRFELFSEGGGNTWGLDFDRHGNVIAGTNYGNAVCLHQVQGGYYVKGFSKHGPLHNPYTYGYFEHMAHTGHVGGHVTCGGIVYQGGAWPKTFNGAYVGANLLSNAIYWSAIEPHGSTFTSRYVGRLLETDDIWFRPIDCRTGPDGSVFVADWYDKRANHVIPEDTWDKTNGRVWKIVYDGTPAGEGVDLSQRSSDELVDLLAHANAWYPRHARRILSERRDPTMLPRLRKLVNADGGTDEHLALEALWALYVTGGWDDDTAMRLLDHPAVDVRAWTVRLIGDERRKLPVEIRERLVQLAATEPSSTVRSQLACTAKRLEGADALAIVEKLLAHDEDASDTHLPLLLWWAIEEKALSDRDGVLALLADQSAWKLPLVRDVIVERLARRYLAERNDAGYETCARLLELAPSGDERLRLVDAMDGDFSGKPLAAVPAPLAWPLMKLWREHGSDPTITRFALRLGSQEAYTRAVARMSDAGEPAKVRLALIAAVGQAARSDALPRLLHLLDDPSDEVRSAALAALGHDDDPSIGREVLDRYQSFSPALRSRAISLAASRAAWAEMLVRQVAEEKIDAKDVSLEQLRQMLIHDDDSLAAAIEARWGKIRPATPGEKMSYVPVLGRVLGAGEGDLERGHKLFMKHCGVCHTLHGEGEKIGPDLTSADRKNRDALLINILDPSGTIRPEYISQTALLVDGRVLTGLVIASDAQQITIVDAKQKKTTIARDEIEQIQPVTTSLMPEGLLEQLQEQEVRDLFRYLQMRKAGQPIGGEVVWSMDRTLFSSLMEPVGGDIRRAAFDRAAKSLQHFALELRKDFGHLAEQIIAVGAGELVHAGLVPPLVPVVGRLVVGQRLDGAHFGVEVRIEEKRERQPVALGRADHAVRRGTIQPARHPVEHVADVADERARHRRRVDPPAAALDLQTACIVLPEDRQQAVVGVLAHAPRRVRGPPGRREGIIENAKQHQRLAGVAIGEVARIQSQPERQTAHQVVPHLLEVRHILEHGFSKARNRRKQVRTVQRCAGQHGRMVGGQLTAEVDAFFPVGPARGQFVADAKIAPPGPAPQGHADLHLLFHTGREEPPAQLFQSRAELLVDAMSGDVKEPMLAASRRQLARHRGTPCRTGDQRRHVD